MEKVYLKIETRKRLTDKELEEIAWNSIENSGKIASIKIRRKIEEL